MKHATQAPARQVLVGNAARRLSRAGWDVRVLRTNDLLKKDDWIAVDTAVVEVTSKRLVGINDLRSRGLTRSLGGLGVLVDEYQKVSNVEPAEQSMSGVAPGQQDLPEYTLTGVPIPITFKDFEVNQRFLDASRRNGAGIDTVAAELSARRVSEKLEDMYFNGSTIKIDGRVIYGLTTHPDRSTGSVGAAWTATGDGSWDPVQDVIDMLADAEANNYRGPFVLYVPTDWNSVLRADYKAESDKTLRQRIMDLDGIEDIKATSDLTAEVVLVQLSRDVVDLSVGQDIVTLEWDSMGGLIETFKIMAAMAPRVKSTADSVTGIVHYS